jgi:hypothetical protein
MPKVAGHFGVPVQKRSHHPPQAPATIPFHTWWLTHQPVASVRVQPFAKGLRGVGGTSTLQLVEAGQQTSCTGVAHMTVLPA